MLALLVRALRGHGCPDTLYLDNGPTYVGETLRTACARLGITLVHAKPHDPQARGKMERFWRTLRAQCVSLMGPMASLHAVQVRLLAWLDQHYLHAPHAGLLGRSPQQVLDEDVITDERPAMSEQLLHEALTIRQTRRLRTDGTLEIAGCHFELEQGLPRRAEGRRGALAGRFLPRHRGSSTTSSVSSCSGSIRSPMPSAGARTDPSAGSTPSPSIPPATLLKRMLSPKKGGDA